MGVFGLCQIFAFIEYVRARLSKEYFETLLKAVIVTVFSAAVFVGVILSITGKILTANTFLSILSNDKIYFYKINP